MKMIDLNMTVKEILSAHPFLMPHFKNYGMAQFEDPKVVKTLGPFLKLKTALKFAKVNETLFTDLLNRTVEEEKEETALFTRENYELQKDATLLALMPCGLKMPFNRSLEEFAREYAQKYKRPLRYFSEGNVNHELSYYPYMEGIEDMDEIPDILISADINSFFHKKFYDTFVRPGHFVSLNSKKLNEDFEKIGFRDPFDHFTMLGANLLILVAVRDRLEGLKIPDSWEELLNEQYANSVVMRGQEDFFCSGVLLPFYKLYGQEGIKRLARSVCYGCHPSEMVKMIDSGKKDIPPFYLMPWFFAEKIRNKKKVSFIFPAEGAIVSPVQMLVKKNKTKEIDEIAQFVTSRELGQNFADIYFPSTHGQVKNNLPPGKLLWIGWDYILANNVGKIKKEQGELFTAAFKATGGRL